MLSGWDFYRIFHSLKLHFTTEQYNVLKYSGSLRVNEEKFAVRNDRMRYENFANRVFNKTKAGHLIIANFVYGDPFFVYSDYGTAYDVYLKWKRIKESITREFELDLQYITSLGAKDLFNKTPKGNMPPLLQMVSAGKINVETVVILNNEYQEFFDNWSNICGNDPMLKDLVLRYRKYRCFVQYDEAKIKNVLEKVKL